MHLAQDLLPEDVRVLSALIFLILTEQILRLETKPSQSWEEGATGSEGPEEFLLDFDVCGKAN